MSALDYRWERLESVGFQTDRGPLVERTPTAVHLALLARTNKFISRHCNSYQRQERMWIDPDTEIRYELKESMTSWWKMVFLVIPLVWLLWPWLRPVEAVEEVSRIDETLKKRGKPGCGGSYRFHICCWPLIRAFYHMPLTKVWTNSITWVLFLAYLTSISFLTPRSTEIPPYEVAFYSWLVMLFHDEVVQVQMRISRREPWHGGFWNWLDFLLYAIFFAWMVLRICCAALDNNFLRHVAHELLLPAIAISFVRVLHVCRRNSKLGPLLLTIGKMATDIGYFLILAVVFVVAFMVIFAQITREWIHLQEYALRPRPERPPPPPPPPLLQHHCHPEEQKKLCGDEWLRPYPDGTLTLSYWAFMGDYDASLPFMHGTRLAGPLLAIYVFISQILLVNLLIAMMSETYDNFKKEADLEWKLANYKMYLEFRDCFPVPPPFECWYLWCLHFRSLLSWFAKKVQPRFNHVLDRKYRHKTPAKVQKDKRVLQQMRDCKQAMLEQDKKKQESTECTIASLKEELNNLRCVQQQNHSQLAQSIHQLQAAPQQVQGVTEASIEQLKEKLQKVEGLLDSWLSAQKTHVG
eukprot:jgi/Mesvir1/18645/Mv17149-RA.1